MFVNEQSIIAALKSDDPLAQIWAIDLLPINITGQSSNSTSKPNIINNGEKINLKCYKYISIQMAGKISGPVAEKMRFSILRECKMRTIEDAERLLYIYPFILDIARTSVKISSWNTTVKEFAKSIKDKDIISHLENEAVKLINACQRSTTEFGVNIIKGLISGGHTLSRETVNFCKQKQYAMRIMLKSFAKMMIRANFQEDEVTSLFKIIPVSAVTVEAIFKIPNKLPKELFDIVQNFLEAEPNSPLITLCIVKNWQKFIDYNFITLENIFKNLIQGQLFYHDNAQKLKKFFLEILEADEMKEIEEKIDIKLLESFYLEFQKKNVYESLEIAVVAVKKRKELENVIILLFCTDRSISFFQLWCSTFKALIDIVGERNIEKMVDFLKKLLICELTNGHKTLPDGTKEFQRRGVNKISSSFSFSDDFEFVHQLDQTISKVIKTNEQIPICKCWREAAQMLLLLPISPSNLTYILRVAILHGKAVSKVMTSLLMKYSDDVVISFFDNILEYGFNQQSLFVNVSIGLIGFNSHLSLFSKITEKLLDLVFDPNTQNIIKCMIIRQFRILVEKAPSEADAQVVAEAYEKLDVFFKGTAPEFDDAIMALKNYDNLKLERNPSAGSMPAFVLDGSDRIPMMKTYSNTNNNNIVNNNNNKPKIRPKYIIPKVNTMNKKLFQIPSKLPKLSPLL